MKNTVKTISEKFLDLANYLLTALLVAYYIEPGANNTIKQEQVFIIALAVIIVIYASAAVLGLLADRNSLKHD